MSMSTTRTATDELAEAIAGGEIFPVFQPIVHLGTGAVVGWEALARWNHPQHGVLDPSHFIPFAEDLGVIGAIDRTMIDQSLAVLAGVDRRLHLGDTTVAVNISGSSLGQGRTAHFVAEALRRHGLPGERLTIEVTETALIDDLRLAGGELRLLRAMGVQISIDDFATGHASFDYLRHLPADHLKLDRSYVEQVADMGFDVSVVRALIALAHDLGMQVIAEGIEDEVQWRILRELGCEMGQGYLFGRPADVPADSAAIRPGLAGSVAAGGFPLPANEVERAALVRDCAVMDTMPEAVFDEIAAAASDLCSTSVARVAIVGDDHVFFKAHVGNDRTMLPRADSLAAYAVCGPEVLVVEDALTDPRFAGNPSLCGSDGMRFFAAAPIMATDGLVLGVVMVIDRAPRALTGVQRQGLAALATRAAVHLELRARLNQLEAMPQRHPARCVTTRSQLPSGSGVGS